MLQLTSKGAKTKTFGYHFWGGVKCKPKCCEHVRLCLTPFSKRLSGNTQVSVRTHELALWCMCVCVCEKESRWYSERQFIMSQLKRLSLKRKPQRKPAWLHLHRSMSCLSLLLLDFLSLPLFISLSHPTLFLPCSFFSTLSGLVCVSSSTKCFFSPWHRDSSCLFFYIFSSIFIPTLLLSSIYSHVPRLPLIAHVYA